MVRKTTMTPQIRVLAGVNGAGKSSIVGATIRDGTRVDANQAPRQQIERAVREAGPGAAPGKVIAELNFGFWRYLSTAAHHYPLWIPYLYNAFKPGTVRQAVDKPAAPITQPNRAPRTTTTPQQGDWSAQRDDSTLGP
jgi:hypothetical protein